MLPSRPVYTFRMFEVRHQSIIYTPKKLVFFVSVYIAVALVMFPHSLEAHATGASWELKQDNYVIDVGYDPLVFEEGSYARFDLALKNEDGSPAVFSEVWVRIVQNKNTLLATGVRHEPIGPTTLLYVFPAEGQYSLEASFRTDTGTELSVGTFPITVASAQSSLPWLLPTLALILGACIGFALARSLPKIG